MARQNWNKGFQSRTLAVERGIISTSFAIIPCRCPVGQHTGVRESPCSSGYRALYEVQPDTGRDETAGDVRVLRVFGPGQSRDRL